jgi:hypothetical protein
MLRRKPLSLRMSVGLFAIAVGMIPLIGQSRRQPVSPPSTLTELAARLSQRTPPLHVVLLHQRKPEGPMWVSIGPRSPEFLQGLVCDPKRATAGQWRGIVYCQRDGEKYRILDDFIHDHWGEYGMRIGPFVFFGDLELLQRIRAEIPMIEG